MTIFERLKKDHDTVRKLLERAEDLIENFPDCDEAESYDLVEELMTELGAHNQAEEEVFYNTLQNRNKDNLLPYESFEEHQLAMSILEELENNDFTLGESIAKLKILKNLILQHIEEEESDVFDLARKSLSSAEQKELVKKFDQIKQEILEGGE